VARIVVYDACVLYPAPLRDLLMQLAVADLFQARWTDEIHDEWIRNVLSDRPDIRPESLARCRELMDRHVPDCLVVGYETLIPTLALPDPDDRHVLAAAIHGQAEVIVTFNLSDFPASVLGSFGIEAIHPDEFIARLWDEEPAGVLTAAKLHRQSLKRPPKTVAEYLATLEQCRLPETVARLRPHSDEI
jgi:predicted nucleic acid-binding protein